MHFLTFFKLYNSCLSRHNHYYNAFCNHHNTLNSISKDAIQAKTSPIAKLSSQQSKETPRSQPSQPAKERTIKVICKVNPAELGVHHFGGTYKPDEFGLEVNKQRIFSQDKHSESSEKSSPIITLKVPDNRIECEYNYSFAWGAYKAKKRAHFEIPENIDAIEIAFSFADNQRVLIPQARFVGPIETVS